MNVVERIINIFFKGYYTKETRRKFNDWIISENHQEDKERSLKKLWDTIHVEPTSDTLDSLHSVEKKIGLYKFTSTKLFRIASIAALFLLPIFSIITVVLFKNQNKIQEIEYSEYFTSNGIINEYLLPDSTKIIMNSGSIIVYPQQNTSGQYIVYLNGEAFFEVNERKKNTPFIVKTDGVKIEVMGTRFNVSAYAGDPDIITTLEANGSRPMYGDVLLGEI